MSSEFIKGQTIGDFTIVEVVKRVDTFNYLCRCVCGKIEMKKYWTSLTRDYVADWSAPEAIREGIIWES